jgi:toxin ParE1/3/4
VKRVTLHEEAGDELSASEEFYFEEGGKDLAFDFLQRVKGALRLVATDPERFSRVPKCPEVQKCRVSRFPFSLYYIDRLEDIWVIAVAHDKRRPGYWEERMS